jgi:hypothetical protein
MPSRRADWQFRNGPRARKKISAPPPDAYFGALQHMHPDLASRSAPREDSPAPLAQPPEVP